MIKLIQSEETITQRFIWQAYFCVLLKHVKLSTTALSQSGLSHKYSSELLLVSPSSAWPCRTYFYNKCLPQPHTTKLVVQVKQAYDRPGTVKSRAAPSKLKPSLHMDRVGPHSTEAGTRVSPVRIQIDPSPLCQSSHPSLNH